jgi:hypothetical protein
MSALGWFMTLGWQKFGGGGIFLIAAAYAIAFLLAGYCLWFSQNLKIPGGLLFTLAVWMAPLAIYGLEELTGIWPQANPGAFRDYHIWVKGSWILVEMGTILASSVALRFIRVPFLTFPIAFSLWYMSMDLTPLLLRKNEFSWNERLWVSAHLWRSDLDTFLCCGPPDPRGLRLLGLFVRLAGFLGRPFAHAK